MRKLYTLAVLILACACLAHTTISTPATIQARLDALPRGTGLVTGDARIGGEIVLSAKSIATTQPIRLYSGQALVGSGMGATEIVYTGPGSAIEIASYAGHGYVHLPSIRNLTIRCVTPGANAIGLHTSAGTVEGLTVRDCVLIGGGVNLPGEHYFVTISGTTVRKPSTQPVRLSGQGHSLQAINVLTNAPVPGVRAAVEIDGSVTIGGWSRVEGSWGVPLVEVRDWRGHQGALFLTDAWLEPHVNGTTVQLTNARANVTEFIAAWPNSPWRLVNSTVNSAAPVADVSGVKADAASKVLVGGVRVTLPQN